MRFGLLLLLAACGDNHTAPPAPDAGLTTPVFAQTAYIKSSTPLHDSHFAAAALSGDGRTLVGSYEGVVTVYERDTGWRMTGDLTPSTTSRGFGWSVAISRDGSTIAVGARDDHPVGNSYGGAVYVFRKSGSTWVEETRIEDSTPYVEFAGKLALSADGTMLIVQSSSSSGDGLELRTYELTANTWNEIPATNHPAFSGPLALSPDGTMLAAAIGSSIAVLARSGNDWVVRATLPIAASSVYFETSIACSDRCETIAVGDMEPPPMLSQAPPGTGAAYVLRGDGTAWTSSTTLHADDAAVGAQFGRSIAVSDDGGIVVVGAPATADYAGSAYVFRQWNGSWPQVLTLKGSNTERLDLFGSRVAVSKDAAAIAVSAIYETSSAAGVNGDQTDNSQPYSGAAYVFEGKY